MKMDKTPWTHSPLTGGFLSIPRPPTSWLEYPWDRFHKFPNQSWSRATSASFVTTISKLHLTLT